MPPARFNIFQSLVRQWESLHPYNGGQLLHVRGAPPPDIDEQWVRTLSALQIGQPKCGRTTYTMAAPDRAKSQLQHLPPGSNLNDFLSSSLNAPFAPDDPVLRPFILPGERSFYMGLSYQHWAADSVGVRMVLNDWFERAVLKHPGRPTPLKRPMSGYRQLFGPEELGGPLGWSLVGRLLDSARQSARMKRVRRVEAAKSGSQDVAFSLHHTRPGTIRRIVTFARANDAKVNDVLLAALAVAVARHGPLESKPHRQDLAMGTIADLRSLAADDLSNTFGLYLGFTTAFLRPAETTSLSAALRPLAVQHAIARATQAAPASMIRMAAGLAAHRLLRSPRSILTFYRKRMPLSAGISNVNLSTDPLARHHPDIILDFIRVSPTGPLMPLVISASTLHDSFQFGLTCRTALVSPEAAFQIASTVVTQLESL